MTPNGVEYVRTLPELYNDESENQFMCQIMTNYALEEKADGKPSGTFRMDQKQTKAASKQVLMQAKGMDDKAATNHLA